MKCFGVLEQKSKRKGEKETKNLCILIHTCDFW